MPREPLRQGRQRKGARVVVGIQLDVEVVIVRAAARGVLAAEHEGEGATLRRPVRLPDRGAVPTNVRIAGADLVAPGEVAVTAEGGMRFTEGDAVPGEAE